MKQVTTIVDLQFGSTGKGLLAGYIATHYKPDTLLTAWGPNAGHTFIDGNGRVFVNIALPNGIVSPGLKRILLGPGSIINPHLLGVELERYADLLKDVAILIHPHAAVVMSVHREMEASYGFKIGSTMKGVGEAVVHKIRRDPDDLNIAKVALIGTPFEKYVVNADMFQDAINAADHILVEGAQGYSLGINSGFYPYTTSRECTVQQLLVDCGLPMYAVDYMSTYGCARTFPIRVANRYDKNGNQIGTSGPCYPDQQELDWKADLGMEPELTTVTKLPRRIFSFSPKQVHEAIRMNGVDLTFLNFVNYLPQTDDGAWALQRYLDVFREAGAPVRWLSKGPTVNDIMEF